MPSARARSYVDVIAADAFDECRFAEARTRAELRAGRRRNASLRTSRRCRGDCRHLQAARDSRYRGLRPGARCDAQREGAGSFGTAGCFSFYPTKNLGALGDGGAVTTSDAAIAERVRELRQYGWGKKYQVSRTGGRNSRLDELQAALLLAKLPHLDRWNEDRRAIARRYSDQIRHPRVECPRDFGADNVAHLFVVRCEDRDGFRRHLESRGVGSDIHYPIPDHRQPGLFCFRLPVSCRKPNGWRRKSSRFHAFPRWRKRKSAR